MQYQEKKFDRGKITFTKLFWQKSYLLLILLCASAVFLTNLGGQGYSLDEPQTVAISKTILIFGYPSGWDTKMYLSGASGKDFTMLNGMYFWTWHPWLQFYLAAPFYYFFGNSVAWLRFPYALFGVASIGIFYLLAKDLFIKKWIAVMLSFQLIFLMPFFLYIRQVRYYSPSIFFSVILFWFILRFIKGKLSTLLLLLFFIAGCLLFSTDYLTWLSCVPVLGAVALWKKQYAACGALLCEIMLAFLWFHFLKPFGGAGTTIYTNGHISILPGLKTYLSYLNNFIFPCIVFPLIFLACWQMKQLAIFWIISLWIGVKILFYTFLVLPHGRYLIDVMPIIILFFGFMYSYMYKFRMKLIIPILFLVIVTTNILSLIPMYFLPSHEKLFRFYPLEFTSELTGTYHYPYEQIGLYLKRMAKPGDLFWSNRDSFDIYLYSTVPTLSNETVCGSNLKLIAGQKPIDQLTHIRWFIFYQGFSQNLSSNPCLGPAWQLYLEKHFVKTKFILHGNNYTENDVDIVNRQFAPSRVLSDSVVIYEKK